MSEHNTRQELSGPGVIWLLFWVTFIWFIAAFVLRVAHPELADRGMFGDSFGAINALFSAAAFALLIYTALLQRKELALQRAELALTRAELSRTAAAQEKSEQALQRQARSLELTGRLNALTAVISALEDRMKAETSTTVQNGLRGQRDLYTSQLNAILGQFPDLPEPPEN